jgi:exopolysaccharide biosynthesis polyprenyl glycosylphosphotransferase
VDQGQQNRGAFGVAIYADSARVTDVARPRGIPGEHRIVTRLRAKTGPVRSSRELLARYRSIVVAADLAAGLFAGLSALVVRFHGAASPAYSLLSLLAPALWVTAVATQRGYENRFLGTGPEEYRRLADATLALFALMAVVSFVFKGDLSRGYVMIALPAALLLSFVFRRRLRSWLFHRRLAGHGLQKVLVVGRSDAVTMMVEQFDREPWHGLVAVGSCTPGEDGVGDLRENLPVSGDAAAILRTVDEVGAEVVAVASHPDLSGHALRRLAWSLEERGVDLIVSPGIVEVAGPRLSIRPVAGLSLLHLDRPVTKGGRMILKSVQDRVLALGFILGVSPVLIAAALAVKLSSPGPVIFRQTRIGVDGKPFEMLKFRSMVVDAEARLGELESLNENDGVLFKIRNDPRITRVGAFLRRFSIDELPQLWNVVRGDMSLVGPRPPLPREVELYDTDATRRLRVRPGLTGLWQVSGRSDLSWEESLRLDLRYVDNWSFWLDLAILWRTWRAVVGRSGAY